MVIIDKERGMAESIIVESDYDEEEEFSYDVSIEDFMESFKNYEELSVEEKDSILHDLTLLIKDGIEDDIAILSENSIPLFLIGSFIEEENYSLFSSVVDCILQWLTNPFCEVSDFYDSDFINYLFFTATKLKADTDLPSIRCNGSITLNETQKLATIFCILIENDQQIVAFINKEQFFVHAATTYFNIVDTATRAKMLFAISQFMKAELEERIEISEITPVVNIVQLLTEQEASSFSFEEYDLICEISKLLFGYSEEFAELFIVNISLMDCINNCIDSDSSYKIRLAKLIFSCYLCDTGDITRSIMIVSLSWSSILAFIDQESDEVLAYTNKFLTFLVAKRPEVLDHHSAATYIQTITSCSSFKGNVEACRLLSTIIQLDHPIVTDYIIDHKFITNSAELLSSNDDELIISVMEAISFIANKYSNSDSERLCAIIDEFSGANLIDAYDELKDSDNSDVSSLAHQFLEEYIETSDGN